MRVFVFVYIYMQQRPHSVAASYNESLAGSWEPSPATFVILSCRQHSRLHSTPSFLPPHPLPPLYSRLPKTFLPSAYLPPTCLPCQPCHLPTCIYLPLITFTNNPTLMPPLISYNNFLRLLQYQLQYGGLVQLIDPVQCGSK